MKLDFSKDTYVQRRKELKEHVKDGIILLFGNQNVGCNYPGNAYLYRQDSTFLYYFGQKREDLVGVIDLDEDKEYLIGNDIDIDDIVWFGKVDTVADMAEQSGVANHAPMSRLKEICDEAIKKGRKIHFLPPYRGETKIQIMDLLGIHPSKQKDEASVELILAVVHQRDKKTPEEIAELEKAAHIGYLMHTEAMRICSPEVTEKYISGVITGIAQAFGAQVSFLPIVTMHGEIMHGYPSAKKLEDGRLLLCDAGAETLSHYCSDNTRTMPINGKYSQRQRELYDIVVDCHDHALKIAQPGIRWWDVHMDVCRLMINRLKDLGLMKGDTEEALASGAHALFMPHGLGHMMGMDVHDMEGLGQIYVGFDEETRPNLDQFGTNCLRCGRRMEEGFVMTDEPGIYFIPDLIDDWRKRGHNAEFLNFDLIEKYKDFGGIRLEDDILITKDGCRFIGKERIPYQADEVEAFMAQK
ncbi:MAG: Xaa-Pro aminopeptidase [Bacteroidales bacterium]|nr:Xaa-Pro aminopeptidase [Bacteroidales bacterium]